LLQELLAGWDKRWACFEMKRNWLGEEPGMDGRGQIENPTKGGRGQGVTE